MPEPTSDAVTKLWQRFRPLVQSRIDVIERFALGDGSVQAEDAARAAHNLAGALGSYGRHDGTLIARRIEHAVRSADPDRFGHLPEELAALRAAVE